MDITTLAAWGECVGGIAVVVSLVYLASQIRQNSKLLRTSTSSTSTAQNEASALIVQDPEVARIYDAGLADRSSLSELDGRRFDTMMGMWVSGWNQEFQFFIDGAMSPSVWESRKRVMLMLFQQSGMRTWWSQYREIYDDAFAESVEGLIREGKAAG
jgi:hypothetical protein